MYGLVVEKDAPFDKKGEVRLLGQRFYVCRLSRRATRREQIFAARRLRRHGVRRCVFPQGFSPAVFAERGIFPPDAAWLLQRKAAEIALKRRAEQGLTGGVALYAERVTPAVGYTLLQLAPFVRTLALNDTERRRTLGDLLLHGVGVVLEEWRAENAETQILFSRPERLLPTGALTLPLYGRNLPMLGAEKLEKEEFPPETDTLSLLSLLCQSGALREEEIFPL